MEERPETQDDVELPEERVEDLAPEEDEADEISGGGKHIGNVKYNDFPAN